MAHLSNIDILSMFGMFFSVTGLAWLLSEVLEYNKGCDNEDKKHRNN